jgi:hypothetical protein
MVVRICAQCRCIPNSQRHALNRNVVVPLSYLAASLPPLTWSLPDLPPGRLPSCVSTRRRLADHRYLDASPPRSAGPTGVVLLAWANEPGAMSRHRPHPPRPPHPWAWTIGCSSGSPSPRYAVRFLHTSPALTAGDVARACQVGPPPTRPGTLLPDRACRIDHGCRRTAVLRVVRSARIRFWAL